MLAVLRRAGACGTRFHVHGPMTITRQAESANLTHSALSQKVAAMCAAGWV